MGLLFGKVNIDDKDLKVIEAIVEKVCGAIDGVATAMNRIADVVEKKKLRME